MSAKTHPCFTLLHISNGSDRLLLDYTLPVMPVWKDFIKFSSVGGHPIFTRAVRSPFLLTASNAFVRSMKARKKGRLYSLYFLGELAK